MNKTINEALVNQVLDFEACIKFDKESDSLEDLRLLIKYIFPEDAVEPQGANFYYRVQRDVARWGSTDSPNLAKPVIKIPLQDFFYEKCPFKRGDKILVSDVENLCYEERIFLTYIEGCVNPYICVASLSLEKYELGRVFESVGWKFAKPLPEKKVVTKQEVAELLGVKVEDLEIKED